MAAAGAVVFYTLIYQLLVGFPWAIAYWTMTSKVDLTQCSGIPLQFAKVAKIVFLVTTVLNLVTIPIQYNLEATPGHQLRDKKDRVGFLFFSFVSTFFCYFAMWIYSCIAVAHRADCTDELMKLIWGSAMLPAALFGTLLCGMLPCDCEIDWFLVYTVIHQVFAGFPWAIAYWTIASKVDHDQCSGIPLQFANVAKIVYLVTTVLSFATIPRRSKLDERNDPHVRNLNGRIGFLFFSYTTIFFAWIAMWIYSWVAVAYRAVCTDDLIKLIWGSAMLPAAMFGALLCCGCILASLFVSFECMKRH